MLHDWECVYTPTHAVWLDCRNTDIERGRDYILPKSHTRLGLKGSDVSHIQLE